MPDVERVVSLPIDIDDTPVAAETRVARAGAYVLVLSTVLPDRPLALELHSTYLGHPDHETLSTHLTLAADLDVPTTVGAVHDVATLDVLRQPRSCLYDHAMRLQELVERLGHTAAVHITASTITQTETLSA